MPVGVGFHNGEDFRLGADAATHNADVVADGIEIDLRPSPHMIGNQSHALGKKVEVRGFEPLAFSLRTRRSTN